MRHFISLKEQSEADLRDILQQASELKKVAQAGALPAYLPGKSLIMYFEKPSTRTRLSFESAMTELGGHAIFLEAGKAQFALADFRDEIRAVMCFGDVLMMRALRSADVYQAASFDRIPVIDGCSEKYHPCQTMADLLTMTEHSGGLENVRKIAWLGIENNVSNTLKLACAKLSVEIALAAPEVDQASVDSELDMIAQKSGKVKRAASIEEALEGADYVYTDTWLNMEFFENGKPRSAFAAEYERRTKVYAPYQLSAKLIDTYAPKARIMHDMPMHVGYEITRDAIDHPNSIIFDQAENRKHAQKAVVLWLLQVPVR